MDANCLEAHSNDDQLILCSFFLLLRHFHRRSFPSQVSPGGKSSVFGAESWPTRSTRYHVDTAGSNGHVIGVTA
jgi:hypothetical protein